MLDVKKNQAVTWIGVLIENLTNSPKKFYLNLAFDRKALIIFVTFIVEYYVWLTDVDIHDIVLFVEIKGVGKISLFVFNLLGHTSLCHMVLQPI